MHKKILKKIFLASSLIAPVAIVTPIVLTSCSTSDSGGGDTGGGSGDTTQKTPVDLVKKSISEKDGVHLLTGTINTKDKDDFKDKEKIESWLGSNSVKDKAGLEKLVDNVDSLKDDSNSTFTKSDFDFGVLSEINSKVSVTDSKIEVTLSLKEADKQIWKVLNSTKDIKFDLSLSKDGEDVKPEANGFKDGFGTKMQLSKDGDEEFFWFVAQDGELDKNPKLLKFTEEVIDNVNKKAEDMKDAGFKKISQTSDLFEIELEKVDFGTDLIEDIFDKLTLTHVVSKDSTKEDPITMEPSKSFNYDVIKEKLDVAVRVFLNKDGWASDFVLTPKDNSFEWKEGSGGTPVYINFLKEIKAVSFIKNIDEFKTEEKKDSKTQVYKFTGEENTIITNVGTDFEKLKKYLETGEKDGSSGFKNQKEDPTTLSKVNIDALTALITKVSELKGTKKTTVTVADTELKVNTSDINFHNLDKNTNVEVSGKISKKTTKDTAASAKSITVEFIIALSEGSYWYTKTTKADQQPSAPITITLELKEKTGSN